MRIRIRPTFAVYVLILFVLSGPCACAGLVTALIVHESFHAAAAKLLHEPIACVELAPFGGVMRYQTGCTPSKGIRGAALALAGPVGNYAVILMVSCWCPSPEAELWRSIVFANLAMMLLNLLPALPFDGGSVLFCLGYYLFDVSRLIGILSLAGVLFGLAFCALACAGMMLYGTLNLTLIVVGAYVMHYARGYKGELLAQNVYALVSEHLQARHTPSRVAFYLLSGEEHLYSLITCLCRQEGTAVFLVKREDQGYAMLGEEQLCRALLAEPCAQVRHIVKKNENSTEISDFSLETLAGLR